MEHGLNTDFNDWPYFVFCPCLICGYLSFLWILYRFVMRAVYQDFQSMCGDCFGGAAGVSDDVDGQGFFEDDAVGASTICRLAQLAISGSCVTMMIVRPSLLRAISIP